MLGRGVDQIPPTPSDPRLFEPVVRSALEYVKVAEDYFPTLESGSGDLLGLGMIPTQTRRLRINRASPDDTHWLAQRMDRECTKLGAMTQASEHTLVLDWQR